MHVGCFIFGGGGVESRPVDGGWGVCKKVLLLPQNGVILVRHNSVGLGLGYIRLYIRLASVGRLLTW